MKTSLERRPQMESEELKAVDAVLKVLESMFFSMPISEEIMEKYNYLKENKFKRAGIEYIPITKSLFPSIGTTPKSVQDSSKYQELEETFTNLYDDQLLLFETILNCITERGNSLIEMSKNPSHSPYSSKAYSSEHAINEAKAKVMRTLKEYQHKKALAIPTEKSQSLRIAELTSKSLPEIGSQMLYKTELAQNKVLNILDTIEEFMIKHESMVKTLKSEISIVSDSSRTKESNLMSEIELLRKQLSKMEANIRTEDMKAAKRYDDVLIRLKEEHIQEINRLRESHQKAIKELNDLHYSELKEMESKLIQARSEGRKVEELGEYTNKLEYAMRMIRERLKDYYDKQRPLQTSWKDEDARTDIEEIMYAEFAIYCANKYGSDNKWLVERLAEFGKENEKLKEGLTKAVTAPTPQFFREVYNLQ